MKLPKLLIIGETGHGKDELCKILVDHFGYNFVSASMLACELCVFDQLKEKYGYASIEDCHADRRNHIEEWVDIIAEYNSEDGAALAKQVMQVSDIYCGVRKRDEYDAMIDANLFDCIIFIDATKRLGSPEESFVELTADDANFTLDNNADLKQLIQRAKRAHARAMQILASKPATFDETETAIVTRDDLVKTSDKEKQQIIDNINEQHEALQPEPTGDDTTDDTEAVQAVLNKPEPVAKQENRPAKAPPRKTTRKRK